MDTQVPAEIWKEILALPSPVRRSISDDNSPKLDKFLLVMNKFIKTQLTQKSLLGLIRIVSTHSR